MPEGTHPSAYPGQWGTQITDESEAKTIEFWVMPDWMRPYEEHIAGHGGNGVEDLMNRLRQVPNLAFTNTIVFTMACEVNAQVVLFHRLREAGLLRSCSVGMMETARVKGSDSSGNVTLRPERALDWLGHDVVRVADVEAWLEGFHYYEGDDILMDDEGEPYTMADKWEGTI